MKQPKILSRYFALVRTNRGIQAALDKRRIAWWKKAHIVGYAVGAKVTGGATTSDVAAVFFVDQKVSLKKLKPTDRIPHSIRVGKTDIPTDVVQVTPMTNLVGIGNPAPNDARSRNPMNMGVDIGICLPSRDVCFAAGTAGAVVVRRRSNDHYMMSAGHVLMHSGLDLIQPDVRFGGHNHGRPQPPPAPPPNPRDNIGSVAMALAGGTVDAGIAECIRATKEIIQLGSPGQVLPPIPTMTVQKSGATTGVTGGVISYVGATIFNNFQRKAGGVAYPGGLQDAFFISSIGGPFAMHGDSGALILAGSPTDPRDLGAQVNSILAYYHQVDRKNGTHSEQNIRQALDRSALGMVLQMFVAVYPGAPNRMEVFHVSQELQVALDALNVDMA